MTFRELPNYEWIGVGVLFVSPRDFVHAHIFLWLLTLKAAENKSVAKRSFWFSAAFTC